MREAIAMLLELSPTTKIMYSSDAHLIPELYYLGAKWGREALGYVLEQAIQTGDLTSQEAEAIAVDILRQNAATLYRISD
jgi:predicted TIM-barrel fold metal-dependent hydrolase